MRILSNASLITMPIPIDFMRLFEFLKFPPSKAELSKKAYKGLGYGMSRKQAKPVHTRHRVIKRLIAPRMPIQKWMNRNAREEV